MTIGEIRPRHWVLALAGALTLEAGVITLVAATSRSTAPPPPQGGVVLQLSGDGLPASATAAVVEQAAMLQPVQPPIPIATAPDEPPLQAVVDEMPQPLDAVEEAVTLTPVGEEPPAPPVPDVDAVPLAAEPPSDPLPTEQPPLELLAAVVDEPPVIQATAPPPPKPPPPKPPPAKPQPPKPQPPKPPANAPAPAPVAPMAAHQSTVSEPSAPATAQASPPSAVESPSSSPAAATDGAPLALSVPSSEALEIRATYESQLLAWIVEHKRYPRRARRQGLEGVVEVTFSLDPRGRVVRTRVDRSSGHPILDEAVIETLARASPMPAPPPGYAAASLDFRLPVSFKLN